MIVRPKTHWLMTLLVWRGSVLRAILPQLGLVLIISSVVTWKHGTINGHSVPLTAIPFTLLGVSIAMFSVSAITPAMTAIGRAGNCGGFPKAVGRKVARVGSYALFSLALPSATVCHCILKGASPPCRQFSGCLLRPSAAPVLQRQRW
jgi:Bestrophin, RFP-TM, chloride channel